MVTNRDYRLRTTSTAVRAIMTPRDRLVYIKEGAAGGSARAPATSIVERVLVCGTASSCAPDHGEGHSQVERASGLRRRPAGQAAGRAAVGIGGGTEEAPAA